MIDEWRALRRLSTRAVVITLMASLAMVSAACQKKESGEVESAVAEAALSPRSEEGAKPADRRAADLLNSARLGRRDQVERLIAEGLDVNARDLNEDTPLVLASLYGHLDVVRVLLARGADLNARNLTGSTALIEAAAANRLEVVQELLRRGADVRVKTVNGLTALDVARRARHSAVVSLLTGGGDRYGPSGEVVGPQPVPSPGVDVNAITQSGVTALMTAAAAGDATAVASLLAAGANPNLATASTGMTALMMAVKGGHTEAVRALLKGGADPNLKDGVGNSCIAYAQQSGNLTIGRILRQAGAVTPAYNQVLPPD